MKINLKRGLYLFTKFLKMPINEQHTLDIEVEDFRPNYKKPEQTILASDFFEKENIRNEEENIRLFIKNK